jgi:hypothetical protein
LEAAHGEIADLKAQCEVRAVWDAPRWLWKALGWPTTHCAGCEWATSLPLRGSPPILDGSQPTWTLILSMRSMAVTSPISRW